MELRGRKKGKTKGETSGYAAGLCDRDKMEETK